MARSVRLSSEEAWIVLAEAHTGIFTSLRRDGTPIALPVWFVAIDRRIYVSGPAHGKKFTRMRNDDRVSFLVESGMRWADLKAVHVTGRAAVLMDSDRLGRVGAALDQKYSEFRTPREDMPEIARAHYDVESATIEIVPDDRVLSWDNSRLFDDQ